MKSTLEKGRIEAATKPARRPAPTMTLPSGKVIKVPKPALERDRLVMRIVGKAKRLSAQLLDFRERSLRDIFALTEKSLKEYGWKLETGARGSIDLHSRDGRWKIEVRKDDKIAFNEQLAGVQTELRRVVRGWGEGSGNGNLLKVIDELFKPGRGGKLSSQRILGLQRMKIDDADWKTCMEALKDAVQVVGSATYLRVYERVGESDAWSLVSLDAYPSSAEASMERGAGSKEGGGS